MAGALVVNRLITRFGMPKVMLIAALAYPLETIPTLLAGPGLAGQVTVTAGFTVLIFASIIYNVVARSFRQLICAPEYLGRMNGSSRWLISGPKPLVAVCAGVTASLIGLKGALVICSVALFSPVAWLAVSKLHRQPGPEGIPQASSASAPEVARVSGLR
jgi:hypothetical protein